MDMPLAQTTFSDPLPAGTPEAEGIPSAAIIEFLEAVEQREHPLDAVHSLMILRHGKVVAEGWWAPYGRDLPHMLYSLSKSFTSTAIGLAVEEGLLGVDDPVLSFFTDDAPEHPSDNLRAITVRHLLSMNTGHHEDTTNAVWRGDELNWPRAFLAQPVAHEPGSWFVYNTAATYMLSAIITHLTGEPLIDYLRPRLFDPLGIVDPAWDADAQGRSIGGSGLHITTPDIARFGQLYLQKGVWEGRRLVPEAWVREATSIQSYTGNTQTNPDWAVGYGYQFWRGRHNSYRGDGAFGQFCLVLPEQDAVVAITSGLRDMQGVLDAVWAHILPAFADEPLPANPDAHAALQGRLASLSLPVVEGLAAPALAHTITGREWNMVGNELGIERIAFGFEDDRARVTITNARGEHEVLAGFGAWLGGTSAHRTGTPERIAACGGWTGEDTFELRIAYTEGEVGTVLEARFGDDAVTLAIAPNVSWGDPAVVTITGQ